MLNGAEADAIRQILRRLDGELNNFERNMLLEILKRYA